MSHHWGETITGEVTIGRVCESLIMEHCLRQRNPDAGGLPWRSRRLRWIPPDTGVTQYISSSQAWRPYYNGVSIAVMLPPNAGGVTGRMVAVFTDPMVAHKVWGYSISPEKKKGSLILQEVGGKWYAIARFRKAGGRKRTARERGKPHDFPKMPKA